MDLGSESQRNGNSVWGQLVAQGRVPSEIPAVFSGLIGQFGGHSSHNAVGHRFRAKPRGQQQPFSNLHFQLLSHFYTFRDNN